MYLNVLPSVEHGSFLETFNNMRPAVTRQLIVPRTRTTYGDRSFSVNGPVV